jgi:dienelactone hydrolase
LSEDHTGFSASVPIVVRLSDAVKRDSATPEHVRLVEVRQPGDVPTSADLVAAFASERHLAPEDIAVAVTFTTEPLAEQLLALRRQVRERAVLAPPVPDFLTDPNPTDDRVFGVFRPGDAEFDAFFDGTPPLEAGLVARGSFLSPDYRVDGRFPASFLDGSASPPHVGIDFLLVRPRDPVPPGGFPTVILQHGFGGDTDFVTGSVTSATGGFLDAGLAVIGIPAPEHGARGNFFDFFDFDDFNAFGNNFRQATVDLLQLVQLVHAGIDADGDRRADVSADGLGYLGVSLGGVIGATFASAEPDVRAAVLNVPGGRLAQFAGSTSSLAAPFLEHFGTEAGLTTRVCGGTAAGDPCTTDQACAEGVSCIFSDDFALLLAAALPNFQWQLDPGDGVSYARAMRIDPPTDRPGAVLLQEGIGDVILTNPLTEALARAIGVPFDRVDSSIEGVAGLWRFPPPAGHGILGLPEVRAQAVAFLASGGTEIIEPPVDGEATIAPDRLAPAAMP